MQQLKSVNIKVWFNKMIKSVWFFPAVLFIILLALTTFKISGTSVGVYSMLDGEYATDSSVIAGDPRGVRSDEWLYITQMVVAQANNNFERINENIGNGQDMSLIIDVPYKEWSVLFKPQNLIFFVLPLENAFAFKWWLLGFTLIISCYFLMLALFPGKILRAILLALIVGLSPMIFWWYQSVTILSIAYSFLIILFTLHLLRAKSTKSRVIFSLVLTYTLVCFGLLLYPPFQIACMIATVVFILGWALENFKKSEIKRILNLWPYAVLIFALVITIIGAFYVTRHSAIKTIMNTAYPGVRVEKSGGSDPLLITSSFLSPNLQYDKKAAQGYLINQSEASSFIFIAPYLFLPSILLIYLARRRQKIVLWGLIFINALLILLLIRMYVSTPWLELFYKLLLLDKVPNRRLLIGVGLTGFLQLVLVLKALDIVRLKSVERWIMAILASLSSLAIMLLVGAYTIDHFPAFIASFAKVLVFALCIAASIFLILIKRTVVGLTLIVLFSLISVYKVHPLYRGLEPVNDSRLIQSIKSYPEDKSWVVVEDRFLINFPIMAGKESLNSIQFYPQLKLWQELDEEGKSNYIYNRFAHIVFVEEEQDTKNLTLAHTDTVHIDFEPCENFLQKHAEYALSSEPLTEGCLEKVQTIHESARDYYIYRIVSASPRP